MARSTVRPPACAPSSTWAPLTNYPLDPNQIVPSRAQAADTPLTVLGHEAGHLFLAFASVPDPADPTAHPMLGYGGAHWSFVFNSEASLDEGEQITDRGTGRYPAFRHHRRHPGLRAARSLPDGLRPRHRRAAHLLRQGLQPASSFRPINHPAKGVTFDGTPCPSPPKASSRPSDAARPIITVAQHRYRFAFILIVASGSQDAVLTNSVQQVETYRQQFPAAYAEFSAGPRGRRDHLEQEPAHSPSSPPPVSSLAGRPPPPSPWPPRRRLRLTVAIAAAQRVRPGSRHRHHSRRRNLRDLHSSPGSAPESRS